MDTSLFERTWNPGRVVVKESRVRAPLSDVWNAWATSAGWRRMMDLEARVELRIGGPYEVMFDTDQAPGLRGSEGCEVLAFIPQRLLSFSWNAPPEFPIERARRTWVVLEFTHDEGKTHIRLTHLGFADHGQWPEVQAYFERVWSRVTDAMEATLGLGKA